MKEAPIQQIAIVESILSDFRRLRHHFRVGPSIDQPTHGRIGPLEKCKPNLPLYFLKNRILSSPAGQEIVD
jgi:hypothetical protein